MLNITSSGSPVGSSIFSVVALLVVSLIVLLILRHFLPLRTTPAFYLVPIFFGLWLPSIIVLLVPIDLASNATPDDEAIRGIWLPERVIVVSWRISYWLTFALTWLVASIIFNVPHADLATGSYYRSLANTPTPVTANQQQNSCTRFERMRSSQPSPLAPAPSD